MAEKELYCIGGGQLIRMGVPHAQRLGVEVTVFNDGAGSPASLLGAKEVLGKYTDEEAIYEFGRNAPYLTVELEHISAAGYRRAQEAGAKVYPHPETIATISNKFVQKQIMALAGVPMPPFAKVELAQAHYDIDQFAQRYDYPVMLKAAFGGYDGRGNWLIEPGEDGAVVLPDFAELQERGVEVFVEKVVDFDKELAVQVVRDITGDVRTYPVVETVQVDSQCALVEAPANISDIARIKAEALALQVSSLFQGPGLICVEMFLMPDGTVLYNETAPRPHNSNHFTDLACETDQFEQHIRTATDMPMGRVDMKYQHAAMVNILQPFNVKRLAEASAIPGVQVTLYGKEPRLGRKVGHITTVGSGNWANDRIDTLDRAEHAYRILLDQG